MKKFLASVLCITFAMSLAACGKKDPEPSVSVSISESTSETSASASAEPSATDTTPAKPNPALEYVKDNVVFFTVKGVSDEETGEKEEDEKLEFHFPELLIKSSYADSVNKDINKIIDRYKKDFKKGESTGVWGSEFFAYLTKEGVLSIVFMEHGDNDCNDYRIFNIDVNTGDKVDNARIAEIAGVSNIRKAAMDALQNLYNNDESEAYKLKDYKVVREKGEKLDEEGKAVEMSFSEKHLNDKMMIGLTEEGKIFFISEFETGAGEFFGMYDTNGKRLDVDSNPCRVGPSVEEDEMDDGGDDGKEGDDFLPEEDD